MYYFTLAASHDTNLVLQVQKILDIVLLKLFSIGFKRAPTAAFGIVQHDFKKIRDSADLNLKHDFYIHQFKTEVRSSL